ncbi:MAG TPA: polysaccharide deacetylase family protein [Thermoanaerobaculia bacterium]|nr:polysaccharide deacetylase family protein [Thermoanaerobaculia bacterium]
MSGALLAAGVAGVAGLGLSLRYNWWRRKRSGTPILMYHEVGAPRPGSALNKWRVKEEDFVWQLDALTRRGYRGVALRELLEPPFSGNRPVVLTFDDGYRGVLTRALPALVARGFSATVFVVADKLGGVNDWDAETPGETLLSADEVRALHDKGLEIGSHGATHRALTGLSDGELSREVEGSREALERVVGAPITSFCYPFGDFDDRVVEAVRRAGYRAATVIRGGISKDLSDPFRLKRIAVRGTNTRLDFTLALTRGRSRL